MSFNLKVDLAIALGRLASESRPLFATVNKIRNKFAHDPRTRFDAKEAADLGNAFSDWQWHLASSHPRHTSTPRDVLEKAIAIIFVEASGAGDRILNEKLYEEVLHEMVEERLRRHEDLMRRLQEKTGGRVVYRLAEHQANNDEEIRRRVSAKKAPRVASDEASQS